MLENYLQKFSILRTDRGRNRYPTATNHRAPHKSFLLLSVMDLITKGQIIENFIEPSFELVDTWNGYWNAVLPIGHRSTMAYPFPLLQTDGFWHRIANPGYDATSNYNISSMTKMIPENVEQFNTEGEQKAYRFLEDVAKPDARYLCWYLPDVLGREPDFILYSQQNGLIILEVKDWNLNQIREVNPHHFVLDIGGKTVERKNPLKQARDYLNSVLDKIKL